MKNFNFKNQKSGFVILYVVLLSSIILAVTLSVTDIAYRELVLSSDARETNDAFFAADTGAECALLNDKATSTAFIQVGSTMQIECMGTTIPLSGVVNDGEGEWSFTFSGLGTDGNGCAKVEVTKDFVNFDTVIISKGYNNGGENENQCDQGIDSIERQIELNY